MSPPHSAAGSTCVSRFFTVTFVGSTPFLLRYSEMNHEPVEPTRVATVLPTRSCGLVIAFLRDRDVAFGIALDRGDGAVVALDAEEVLHARQVAGHDDVALPGLERLERGRAGGKQPVGDVETFLLIEALLERHPDRVIVDGGLAEQRHLQRRLLRLRRRSPRSRRRNAIVSMLASLAIWLSIKCFIFVQVTPT